MRKTHDVVATVGEYKDPSTGEMKKRRIKVGAAFTNDKGQIAIKLEAVPCAPDWSGWVNLYEPDTDSRQSHDTAGGRSVQRTMPPQPSADGVEQSADDDIPF
jgi:hypothetical protein